MTDRPWTGGILSEPADERRRGLSCFRPPALGGRAMCRAGAGASSGSEAHKLAEVASRTDEFLESEASKPFGWGPKPFLEWATVEAMLEAVGLASNATVLDIGCASGWSSLFLAEAGYNVIGADGF
jgi:SAM-dependent methyltransferase